MNSDQAVGKFEQLKGEIKKVWGKLTDDDILAYQGNQDKFFGKVKEKYGLAREAAEERIQEFHQTCATSSCGSDKKIRSA